MTSVLRSAGRDDADAGRGADTLFAKLRKKFTDGHLVELTATLAWENYRARFDHAFGVEAEGFTQGTYCAMPVRGQAKAQTQHH